MLKKSILFLSVNLIVWNSFVYASSPLDNFNEKLNKIEEDTIKSQKQEQENQRINEERKNDPNYMVNKYFDDLEDTYIKNAFLSSSGFVGNSEILGFSMDDVQRLEREAKHYCDVLFSNTFSALLDGVYKYVINDEDSQLTIDQKCLSKIKINNELIKRNENDSTFKKLDNLIQLAAKRAELFKPRYLAAKEEADKEKKLLDEENAKVQAIANKKAAQAAQDAKQEKARKKTSLKLKMNQLCRETDNIMNMRRRLITATKQVQNMDLLSLGIKHKYGITADQAIERCVDRMVDSSSYSKQDGDFYEYTIRGTMNLDQDIDIMCEKDKKVFAYMNALDRNDPKFQDRFMKVGSDTLGVIRCVGKPNQYLN